MKTIAKTALLTAALTTCASVVALAIAGETPTATSGFEIAVDESGSIHVPDVDYRRDWTLLGTWAVAADDGALGSQGMHVVYTQPEAVTAYRETGEFPDGTVLIKDLFSTTTEDMTTGTISRAGETAGWFVMVKDSTDRYPDNALWGDGWGWAFFDASSPPRR